LILRNIVIALALLSAAIHPALAQPAPQKPQRENLDIAAANGLRPYVEMLAGELVTARSLPKPEITWGQTAEMASRFCAGVGPATPDILVLDRRLGRAQLELCSRNDVARIVELGFGIDAVVLVGKRGGPILPLTAAHLYRGLAATVPLDGRFVPNPYKRWKDVDPVLPDQEIRLLVPPVGSRSRLLFEQTVLQDGCREVPEVRAIFSARARVARCIELRQDGPVRAVAAPDERVAAVLADPNPLLALVELGQTTSRAADLAFVALDGIRPTYQTITDDTYPAARRIFIYVKRQNMRDAQGIGAVRGIRDFMTETTSERMIGPEGSLPKLGLVALPAGERVELRRVVRTLQSMTP
jgi:phosphate transport system substrate-binding protein